jgi:purine nucleosidase
VVSPRMRVLIDNDYSGDPDGLVQLAHHLLSPSVEIPAIIGSHLRPGDPFDPSEITATNACARAAEVVEALGQTGRRTIVEGSNVGLASRTEPIRSAGALAIVAEAMRDDTTLPLYFAAGAGLTELASAWLIEPRIADRLTLVWIGGLEDPAVAVAPPGASAVEYNLNIDPIAASVIFNDSDIPIWQVSRAAYRQTLLSTAEIESQVRPQSAVGELLATSIARIGEMGEQYGFSLGETYIMGDSPLILLTALQSAFEADPSSSEWIERPAPTVNPDGSQSFGGTGRPIRVYTRLDTRLMFGDFFAKLAAHANQYPTP